MKRLAIALLVLALCLPGVADARRKKKRSKKTVVAVMELDAGPGVSSEASAFLTAQVEDAIFRLGSYKLVSRGQIRKVLKEQALGQTGCTDQSCAAEVGRLLNAEKIVSGKVTKWGGSYQVSLQLIGVELGMIEKSGLGKCSGCEGNAEAVGGAVSGAGAGLFGPPVPAPAAKPRRTARPTPKPRPDSKSGEEWVYSKPAGLYFTRSEVTLGQFKKCVSAGGCKEKNRKTNSDSKYCNWGWSGRDNHPMNCVDWYGARDFCRWAGGRLPTEDEWYKEASNGGRRAYPWGEEEASCRRAVMDDGGNGCGENRTWPVCSKRSGDSVSGLCDMSGNVWEWTPTPEGTARVLRGGAWYNYGRGGLRASGRDMYDPGSRHSCSGFRCVRSSH